MGHTEAAVAEWRGRNVKDEGEGSALEIYGTR